MFTRVVEFVNGSRKFFSDLNRVACENLIEKFSKETGVSYVGVLDERF